MNTSFETILSDYEADLDKPLAAKIDPKTIFGWLVGQKRFKKLVGMIVHLGLFEYYNSCDTLVTLFATPDDKFSEPAGMYDKKRYLDYVTAPAALGNNDLIGKIQTRDTLMAITATRTKVPWPKWRSGRTLDLDNMVLLNDSVFVTASVPLLNGYVHVITGPLLP